MKKSYEKIIIGLLIIILFTYLLMSIIHKHNQLSSFSFHELEEASQLIW